MITSSAVERPGVPRPPGTTQAMTVCVPTLEEALSPTLGAGVGSYCVWCALRASCLINFHEA